MNDIVFAGVQLDDHARSEAAGHLAGQTKLVVIPGADSSTLPNPWHRLPKGIAWLVADVFGWASVAWRASLSHDNSGELRSSDLAGAFERGEVVVLPPRSLAASPELPSLTPRDRPAPAWLMQSVDSLEEILGQPIRSQVDLTALRAGILQMADHLTASHEASQSIEGRGKRHAGDFWHAINHRREPDYGNAKYWFRHVGDHPLYADLAAVLPALANEFSADVAIKAKSLVDGGRFDPFRFVDLVNDACRRKDRDLIRFAERVQWLEMVGLLEWTLKDAVG